jgi:hypothetical protein
MMFDPLSGIYLTDNKRHMAVIFNLKYTDVQPSMDGHIIA